MIVSTNATELYRAYSQCYATEANRRRIAFYIDLAFAIAALVLTTLTVAESAAGLVDSLNRWLPLAALFWLGLIVDCDFSAFARFALRGPVRPTDPMDAAPAHLHSNSLPGRQE